MCRALCRAERRNHLLEKRTVEPIQHSQEDPLNEDPHEPQNVWHPAPSNVSFCVYVSHSCIVAQRIYVLVLL